MKKILLMLLSLLCCMTAVWAETGDGLNLPVNEDGYIEVRTGEELVRAIRNDNSARIRLAVDSINVGGLGQICETFSGEIVGGHMDFDPKTGERIIVPHAIYGRRGQGKGADSPLFDKLEAAHFENVAFVNFRVEDEDNEDLGVVARTATLTTFKCVTAVGVSVFCNHDNAGTFVGVASNCTFQKVKALACEVTTDGICAGGIVGSSYFCNFNCCANNQYTHVFADGRQGVFFTTNAACAGGISGYSMSDHFYACGNLGWVGGDEDQVGGIVGTSMGSDFTLCTNFGIVLQASEENFVKAIEGSLKETVDYDHWMYPLKNIWVVLGETVLAGGGLYYGGLLMMASGDFWPIGMVVFAVAFVGMVGLVVANMIMNAHDELGGIAGHAEGGYFEQCANEGLYNAVDEECGGIVGKGSSLVINNCYSVRKPGGITHIKNVEKLETNAAIIGSAEGCTITNNYAICSYRAIGKVKDMNPASGNNYYVSDSEVDETSDYEMRATTEQMNSGQLAYWLNTLHTNELSASYFNALHPEWNLASRPWRQNLTGKDIDSSPTFDQTHDAVRIADITTLTHITDAEGLKAYAQRVNNGDQFACAVLDDDIALSGKWTPIGHNDHSKHFRGIFDGQGHTISGLNVEMNKAEDGAGLFGAVHSNAVILNVTVDDTSVVTNTSDGGAAGIVGLVYTKWMWSDMIIENCASYASVNANKHAGGILGRIMTGENNGPSVNVHIKNCYNMGTITAKSGNSGLLCGYTKNHAHVSNCWSAGQLRTSTEDVKPYDDSHGQGHAEFFVGYWDKLDIRNCFVVEKCANVDGTGNLTSQDGVEDHTAAFLTNGELCYKLNNGVVDGSQRWYQTVGADDCPVRTKLTDGTNIVFRYKDAKGITRYGNTSREEIADTILGITAFDDHRITDINQSGDVDVADVMLLNAAAIR